MKVAVLISGEYRGFDICVQTMANILSTHDIYFSTWSETTQIHPLDANLRHCITDITEERIIRVLSQYNVKKIKIDHFDRKYWQQGRKYNSPMCNRWDAGLKLIHDSGIEYDYLIVLRPDLYFRSGATIDWSTIKPNTIYSAWWAEHATKFNEVVLVGEFKTVVKCLLTEDTWVNSAPEEDWHDFLYRHIISQSIKSCGFTPHITVTMARPPLSRIKTYNDAITQFDHYRNLFIKLQKQNHGSEFVRTLWGEKFIDALFKNNLNLSKRVVDVISKSEELEILHIIPNFPIQMICTDQPIEKDITLDQVWEISPMNGIIQLRDLLPLDVLYNTQHSGKIGSLWKEHHNNFANFIHRSAPTAVLEIGAGHGILSEEYNKLDNNTKWVIVDPLTSPVLNSQVSIINKLFDNSFVYTDPIDTVVHSHLFEHIYAPREFMEHLSKMMPVNTHLIFSVPNLYEMLSRNYTNAINFEHTVLLTEPYIDYLLTTYGFNIINKEYFKDDHSIFYRTIRSDNVPVIPLPNNMYDINNNLYKNYINYHKMLVTILNEIIENSNTSIYLFGAHIFSQFLIKMGLDTSKIISILDNDLEKHEKRLYGTQLTVKSPLILDGVDRPIVILKAGAYNDEIRLSILNINQNTIFL
jgi:hypothetical protein